MQHITLQKPAIISGKTYPANFSLKVSDLSLVEKGYALFEKQKVRRKIEQSAGDLASLLGTTSDAAAYALDDTAMDLLAITESDNSSYKSARIRLFEEQHGKGSWEKATMAAQRWFDGRKANTIQLPIDVKGIDSVFADIATRSTSTTQALK